MLFEQKKIQIETLNEYLSGIRADLKLSPEEVCKKTGITLKFLNALEDGNFKILPADVYVFGFLRQMSLLYFIDAEALIEQFKKERKIQQLRAEQNLSLSQGWQKKYLNKITITPKILSLSLGLAFVAISVGYIIWQVWSINRTPSLEIIQPANNSVIEGSSVEVLGRTDPGMNITVNEQIIFVDNKGDFQAQVSLSPGPKEIVIKAKNRFDKSVEKILNITGALQDDSGNQQSLQLKVDFSSPVTLTFAIDGTAGQTLVFNQGDSKTFLAKNKIVLSTSDAGATKVTLNGQNMGAMGRAKERLNNITFVPPTGSVPGTK